MQLESGVIFSSIQCDTWKPGWKLKKKLETKG